MQRGSHGWRTTLRTLVQAQDQVSVCDEPFVPEADHSIPKKRAAHWRRAECVTLSTWTKNCDRANGFVMAPRRPDTLQPSRKRLPQRGSCALGQSWQRGVAVAARGCVTGAVQ